MSKAFLERRLSTILSQLRSLPANSSRRADLIVEMNEIKAKLGKN